MKKILFLFLLFCNSIYGATPYSNNFDIFFEQVLNQIITAVGPTKISSDQYYSLTYYEFGKLRDIIADLVLHVHNNSQLATLMIVINKLQNSIVDKFPADSIKGYDQLKRQNQHHVRCITAMFTCALADTLIYTFGDEIVEEFKQECIAFKEQYYKSVYEESEKHSASIFTKLTSKFLVVDVVSVLAHSAFNEAFARRFGLTKNYYVDWEEPKTTANFLLNDIILAVKPVHDMEEIYDILSKKISTLMLSGYSKRMLESIIDEIAIIASSLGDFYSLKEEMRNVIKMYSVSLNIIFKCAFYSDKPSSYAWYTRKASSPASQLERFTYDGSKRYVSIYEHVSCVLKKTFKQLKDANFKNDNKVFSEIVENYEEYAEKLDAEISHLCQFNEMMDALASRTILGMMGLSYFIASCVTL